MLKARHRINLIKISRRPGLWALALAVVLGLWVAGTNPVRAAFEIQPGQTRDFRVDVSGPFDSSCFEDPLAASNLPFSDAFCQVDDRSLPPNIQLFAAIPLGLFATARATGRYGYDFSVPTGPNGVPTVLDAQVSGEAEWDGFFTGLGIFGSSAEFRLTIRLIDMGLDPFDMGPGIVVASTIVHEKELSDNFLLTGGTIDKDGKPFNFSTKVTRGRFYRVEIEAQCEVKSGLLAADVICGFGAEDELGVLPEGGAKLTSLRVTVAHDEIELLLDIKDQLASHDDRDIRQFIETNLADCTMLVTLFLPSEHGGQVETVGSLLEQWIEQVEAIGSSTDNARGHLERGLDELEAGAFKSAYQRFCTAYHHLTTRRGNDAGRADDSHSSPNVVGGDETESTAIHSEGQELPEADPESVTETVSAERPGEVEAAVDEPSDSTQDSHKADKVHDQKRGLGRGPKN